MKRLFKWIGMGLGGLVVLALLAAAGVYVVGGRIAARTYDVPSRGFTAARADSAIVTEGRRLATIRGCPACHGDRLEGSVFFDDPLVARLVAPNLTALARAYSDADLERAIRHGLRPSGKSLFAMPASTYYHLSDADLGAIAAFLRTAPAVENTLPRTRIRLLGRLGLIIGQYSPEATLIDHAGPRVGDAPDARPAARGRYLAFTTCTECHGLDLQGGGFFETPSLSLVAGYSEAQFTKLLRTGIAPGDRELAVMAEVARKRLVALTDEEVQALYAFLSALPPGGAAAEGG
jgi:cytochrome c553